MFRSNSTVLALLLSLVAGVARGHDTWVQVDAPLLRRGDVAHVHLMLGNHGNGHRDFKIAGKISPEGWTLETIGPGGQRDDLKPRLVDVGFASREGFWSGRYVASESGLHVVAHALDKLHGTTRAIKSGKCYFIAGESLDAPASGDHAFTRPLGHAMEIIPLMDPVLDIGAHRPARVRLLYDGKPLSGETISFIPRGAKLKEEFDPDFERTTDANGEATFTPSEGNWLLVVAHHRVPELRGEGYDNTHFTATLTLNVPQIPRGPAAATREQPSKP